MVNYICPKCNKEFNKKCNYVDHTENKKNACDKSDFLVPPNSAKPPPKSANFKPDFMDFLLKEPEQPNNDNKCICTYCEKSFTRIDSLKKHLNGRCKSKENHDELEKLKEEMKFIMEGFKNLQNNYQTMENNYQTIENENMKLKNEIEIIQKGGINNKQIINNNNNTQNINDNRQINKGLIQNNFIVQFVHGLITFLISKKLLTT